MIYHNLSSHSAAHSPYAQSHAAAASPLTAAATFHQRLAAAGSPPTPPAMFASFPANACGGWGQPTGGSADPNGTSTRGVIKEATASQELQAVLANIGTDLSVVNRLACIFARFSADGQLLGLDESKMMQHCSSATFAEDVRTMWAKLDQVSKIALFGSLLVLAEWCARIALTPLCLLLPHLLAGRRRSARSRAVCGTLSVVDGGLRRPSPWRQRR